MPNLSLKSVVLRMAARARAYVSLLGSAHAASPAMVPQFTHAQMQDWINSSPLTMSNLRGKVVLIEFWAFDCINCLHSAAWIESVATRDAAAGLTVIGVIPRNFPRKAKPPTYVRPSSVSGLPIR